MLNGKRPHEPKRQHESANTESQSSMKRPKTLTMPNGVDHPTSTSPNMLQQSNNTNKTTYNGYGIDSRSPHLMKREFKQLDGRDGLRDTVHHYGTAKIENDLILSKTERRNPAASTDNILDLKAVKKETLPLSELSTSNGNIQSIKEVKDDPKAGGEPEIITLSDSEDEFQEACVIGCTLYSSLFRRCLMAVLYYQFTIDL